jgi:hypothetical protein
MLADGSPDCEVEPRRRQAKDLQRSHKVFRGLLKEPLQRLFRAEGFPGNALSLHGFLPTEGNLVTCLVVAASLQTLR